MSKVTSDSLIKLTVLQEIIQKFREQIEKLYEV